MTEYIEREAVLEITNRISDRMLSVSLGRKVVNLPAADVAPVVHGDWVVKYDSKKKVWCSVCDHVRDIYAQIGWHYCPNCGAHMKDGDDNG